jgi:hypothetical protein
VAPTSTITFKKYITAGHKYRGSAMILEIHVDSLNTSEKPGTCSILSAPPPYSLLSASTRVRRSKGTDGLATDYLPRV